jgi:DNA-binding NarL/FixJ family response regulator
VVSPELATHLLREFSGARTGDGPRVRPVLSRRESSVLRLLANGSTDDEIAAELFISPRTVQNHLHRVREKIGLRRRADLTRWAVQHAIL